MGHRLFPRLTLLVQILYLVSGHAWLPFIFSTALSLQWFSRFSCFGGPVFYTLYTEIRNVHSRTSKSQWVWCCLDFPIGKCWFWNSSVLLLITPWQESKTKGPPSFHRAVNHYQAWNLCNCWQVVNVVSFVFWNRKREWQQKENRILFVFLLGMSFYLPAGGFPFRFFFLLRIFILLCVCMYVYIFIFEHTYR